MGRRRGYTLFPYTTLFRSREARQHLEVLLERVLELARIGGARARADPEVIEDHVVGPVASRRLTEIRAERDRKSTRLNSSHSQISYAVFCLKKKNANLNEN